jgi:hypothetical protein
VPSGVSLAQAALTICPSHWMGSRLEMTLVAEDRWLGFAAGPTCESELGEPWSVTARQGDVAIAGDPTTQ